MNHKSDIFFFLAKTALGLGEGGSIFGICVTNELVFEQFQKGLLFTTHTFVFKETIKQLRPPQKGSMFWSSWSNYNSENSYEAPENQWWNFPPLKKRSLFAGPTCWFFSMWDKVTTHINHEFLRCIFYAIWYEWSGFQPATFNMYINVVFICILHP